jgi:putative Mn2+ efflux pump MntP
MTFGHALSPVLRSWVEIAGPVLVAATGIVVLSFPDLAQRALSSDRWVLMGVPIAFTLDNLNVGVGRGLDHMPALLEPVVIGVVSGLMAWLGIGLAARFQRLLPEYTARAAGVMLLAVAVHEYVT